MVGFARQLPEDLHVAQELEHESWSDFLDLQVQNRCHGTCKSAIIVLRYPKNVVSLLGCTELYHRRRELPAIVKERESDGII